MNKEKPVIIQFESDENYMTVADLICYNMGLEVAAKANSIQAARELIAKIEKKELNPDIAIVSSVIENNFSEGEKLAKKLREIAPELKIIAFTELEDEKFGDKLALKSGASLQDTLIAALHDLTGHDFNGSNVK
jgi:hypothetical protein